MFVHEFIRKQKVTKFQADQQERQERMQSSQPQKSSGARPLGKGVGVGDKWLFVLMIAGAAIAILKFLLCFAIAFTLPVAFSFAAYLAFKIKKRQLTDVQFKKLNSIWLGVAQLLLYFGAWLTFKNAGWVKDVYHSDGSIGRLSEFKTWNANFNIFLYGALPTFAIYLYRVRQILFKKQTGNTLDREITLNEEKEESETKADLNSDDPFQIIGVSQSASEDEIKSAYRELISQYHPDKVESLGPELKIIAEEKTKSLNWAYQECLKRKAA